MNPTDFAGLSIQHQLWLTWAAIAFKYLAELYSAVRGGGGLKRIIMSFWFGEQVPEVVAKDYKKELTTPPFSPGASALFFTLAILGAMTALVGCAGSWPKDSYIVGAKSEVNTPWGPIKQNADVMATGVAARNASITDTMAEIARAKAGMPRAEPTPQVVAQPLPPTAP